ncbi:MAG TPA: hypothetical protein VFQ53_24650 [Kofleriaceae bacterium]|nr:hypothetical protein [Kofleriaceae bacterium]
MRRLVAAVLLTTITGCATTSTGSRRSEDLAYLIIGGAMLTGLVIGVATDHGGTRPAPTDPPTLPEPY